MTGPDTAARYADYARARLRVRVDGRTLTLHPRVDGTTRGDFPFDADAVHVVTAFDPGPVRLSPRENADRQARLAREVAALGVGTRDAVAGGADGSHEEACVLVEGLTDAHARRIGAAWEQDAIFRWSRATWTILPCDDRTPPVHLGWEISVEEGPRPA